MERQGELNTVSWVQFNEDEFAPANRVPSATEFFYKFSNSIKGQSLCSMYIIKDHTTCIHAYGIQWLKLTKGKIILSVKKYSNLKIAKETSSTWTFKDFSGH